MNLFDQIKTLNFPAPLPETLLAVEQHFDAPQVADVATATQEALHQSELLTRMQPGDSVAVGVGSRGIANLATIVRTTVEALKAAGLKPFIIPAMGSHGGATVEGQIEVLANLGITVETVGADIRATMEVRQIGQLPDGPPLFQDVISAAADHTLLINRIKPHTSFHGELESGLAKMAVIGLGKQRGAEMMHSMGVEGLRRFIVPAARLYETKTNLRGGLAIVENTTHQTAEIVGLSAADIGGPRETELLWRSKELMPSLPFEEIDVLVVREMGKNISGTGMDTNVINRLDIPGQPEPPDKPRITIIAVLDLTEATHGNCTGLGLANVTTARLAQKIDWTAFYTNALTSGILNMARASLPMTLADDRQTIQAAVRGCGQPQQETVRLVFIHDTLSLDRFWVSPSLRETVEAQSGLKVVETAPLRFDETGRMVDPWELGD